MKTIIPTILFLLLTSSTICAQEGPAKSPAMPEPDSSKSAAAPPKRPDMKNLVNLTGQKAPNFTYQDANGKSSDLESLRGKIVVINLWATWCQPCIEEIPELNGIADKFKDKDVIFLAASPEDKTIVENFLKKNPFSYQIIPGALPIIKQYSPKEKPDPATGKARTIQALPTHIVIDRDGTVVKHFWGFGTGKIPDLIKSIEQLTSLQIKS